jgi:hypothetical protein
MLSARIEKIMVMANTMMYWMTSAIGIIAMYAVFSIKAFILINHSKNELE